MQDVVQCDSQSHRAMAMRNKYLQSGALARQLQDEQVLQLVV